MARKKRYVPSPDSKTAFRRHTRASLDVLETIYEQEFVRSSSLDTLLPHRNNNGLRQTLARLHLAELVAKVVTASQNLYCPDIYYVTPKGQRVLKEHRAPDRFVNTYRPKEDYRIEFQHKIGISDTIANLRSGAIEAGCKMIPHSEIQRNAGIDGKTPMKLPASVQTEINGIPRTWSGDIEPDGIIGIEYLDGRRSFVALEYQNKGKIRANALLGVSSIKRKFLAYVDAYMNQSYKSAWGISNLRVLFVFAHQRDFQASVRLGEEMYPDGNPMFLLRHIPNFRETKSGMLIAPLPYPALFHEPLDRINKPPIALFKKLTLTGSTK